MLLFFFLMGSFVVLYEYGRFVLQRFKGIKSSWWKSINAPNTTILTAVLNNTLQSRTTIIPSLQWKEGQRFLCKMIAKIWKLSEVSTRRRNADEKAAQSRKLLITSCSVCSLFWHLNGSANALKRNDISVFTLRKCKIWKMERRWMWMCGNKEPAMRESFLFCCCLLGSFYGFI